MNIQKYSKLMVTLHWISALVICWALVSGFYTGLLPVNPEIKKWVAFVNVSVGTLFIPVFILRFYARQTHVRPAPSSGKPFEQLTAALVQSLIYGTVSLVLVTGVLMMERPINVFNAISIPNLINDPRWLAALFTVHEVACALLAVLVVMHIAGVIKHEVSGARIIQRMSL
ncbi:MULTISPECIES: cytochrome b/b6 domain-containing protein [unclassified Pseudomonas]|uniref:cytochrome b n=1 Tax=unclassified Pseudomonas TaxID=196821 RepID=UPI002AC93299|nr:MULTISPECIES: cytochrome b/b6 domain-containing protein [unclassified Pseudomonas]MEB0040201.1 cytochrome b/b6 domain-containing protein [Pseudomonas sp. MH10]MEB0079063.1 cytochrome b/b6 domain-containing protein [Pseudomonas sp. MH10out]MEB0090604.1 cytochrome b/b6 domain-containing protein [Pseudomonas sp. CCI4.2]MEB0102181.1 cytochrome b/b6 domain-containing protein [Pseudomonas sp. CCI3.2]MEB0119918.1 cytochrome b/b6 domain-containing protein [Pseudomonas sp. CCI1.2]